jgi:hypothetical protein
MTLQEQILEEINKLRDLCHAKLKKRSIKKLIEKHFAESKD